MSDAQQQNSRSNGRVTRFPVYEPWRDPRRRDASVPASEPRYPQRQRAAMPAPAAPRAQIKAPPAPQTFGTAGGRCRLGVHQLTGLNRRVIAGRTVCSECFQSGLRRLG